jgi:hypothetical protein
VAAFLMLLFEFHFFPDNQNIFLAQLIDNNGQNCWLLFRLILCYAKLGEIRELENRKGEKL